MRDGDTNENAGEHECDIFLADYLAHLQCKSTGLVAIIGGKDTDKRG